MNDSRVVFLKHQTAVWMPKFRKFIAFSGKAAASVLLIAGMSNGQQVVQEAPQPSTSLASQFFEHDFVNVFVFGNGIYDTALPQLTAGSQAYGGAFGYDVGGGLTAGRNFKNGTFSLSYKGDYRHYSGNNYSGGTNQNFSALLSTRLNKQWSLAVEGGGGIISYGGQLYGQTAGSSVLTNPFSSQSRFANSSLSLTYQQTKRLSYTLGGQFFLNNYNYPGAINSIGGSGTASLNYRTTSHTTIGGTYSRSYFSYSGSLGTTTIDGGYLTLSHVFPAHWTVSLSAGVSRSHSKGIITEPISLLLGQQIVNGFIIGPFDRVNNSPSFQASVGRTMRHSLFSINGGQGVNAGNGTFLTSRNQFVNATYSITHRLTNLSFGGGYTRLVSISNTVSTDYATATASVSYGFNVVRYVSTNLRYDFIHYDGLYALRGINESRFSFGLTFSSKSVPLTLF